MDKETKKKLALANAKEKIEKIEKLPKASDEKENKVLGQTSNINPKHN